MIGPPIGSSSQVPIDESPVSRVVLAMGCSSWFVGSAVWVAPTGHRCPVVRYTRAGQDRKRTAGPSAGPANRQALIVAAREVFAESGFNAPLSAVARRAGVGQGSLYRHFPDRIALAVAVFDDNITDLEALGTRAGRDAERPVRCVAEQALGSTALIEVVSSGLRRPADRPPGRAGHRRRRCDPRARQGGRDDRRARGERRRHARVRDARIPAGANRGG